MGKTQGNNVGLLPFFPWPEIGVLLLELGVGLVSRVSLVYISHGKGEGHVVHAGVNCVCNVCGSTHSCGGVVNGLLSVIIIDRRTTFFTE